MKFVVVNADDLGIAPSVNDAICQAATDGLLTSASLMPSMPAFEHAIQCVSRRCPELGLGAHLCLTSGRPITPPREIPLLVDAAGRFRHSFGSLWRLCHSAAATDAGTQIRQEWTAQLDRLDAAGIALDHVDSHQHVHAIPPLTELLRELALRYPSAWIRWPHERFGFRLHMRSVHALTTGTLKRMLLQHLLQHQRPPERRCNQVLGITHSGRVGSAVLQQAARSLAAGVTEIITHPGAGASATDATCCSRADTRFLRSRQRAAELAALTDGDVVRAFESAQAVRCRFRDLPTP